MNALTRSTGGACVALALAVSLTGATTASTSHHKTVDQTQLVPTTLDSSFAPFDCKLKKTGPVCTGDRYIDTGWEAADWPCDVPVFGRYVSYRHQTRYYDLDYLNYDRLFRTKDVDYVSTSPDGTAAATITLRGRFTEPFAIPGDDSTFTVITTGTIWDIKPAQGRSLFRVVGTLVEPPDAEPTFTGRVTVDGVTTRYDEAPLSSFFSEEMFFETVCRAVTSGA